MFKVRLTDFRCFADTSSVNVLPITFLVGENSTGKTSFLAAIRQLMEGFSRSAQNPFNREPYFLGGFDQIARYRGGRGGRARSFSLEITVPPQTPASGRTQRLSTPARHRFTFSKGSPQPELSEYSFSTPDESVTLDLAGDTLKLTVQSSVLAREVLLDTKRLPPVPLLRRDISFLRFIFDELAFGMGRKAEGNEHLENLMRHFRLSARQADRRTFAFAPVRTQPLRTYTPSEIQPSSQGSHVPLEMAQRKINSPAEWDAVHKKLATFGTASGLFEEVDIRLLGKHDGDPFQVMVKNKGPRINLVDVGYGVSQALPIVYQLEQARGHDVYLMQQPEVHLHPKAQAALGSLIANLSRQHPRTLYVVETHSDYIIDRVRMEVAQGNLNHRNVTIVFFDRHENEIRPTNIYLTENGDISDPPPNFRSFFLEEHARLLGL